jgi:hypothetical protein
MGFGVWGMGPNPQSPIPNPHPQSPCNNLIIYFNLIKEKINILKEKY